MHVRRLVDAPDRLANLLFKILERVLKSRELAEEHLLVLHAVASGGGIRALLKVTVKRSPTTRTFSASLGT